MIPAGDVEIAPSILAADYANLEAAMSGVATATQWLHVDVMDGHFVPNITIGPPVVASLRRHSELYFDCHLMIEEPNRYLEAFRDAGASSATIHVEVGGTAEHLAQMRELGLGVGLACNPDTPFSAVEPFLDRIDLLLCMTVFPGFGGQSFIEDVLPKVAEARTVLDRSGLAVVIEVDGGVDEKTIGPSAHAGARIFVAGSAVFNDEDPADAVTRLRAIALGARRGGGDG
jgi:ribulose-phosphate 3-epimerase